MSKRSPKTVEKALFLVQNKLALSKDRTETNLRKFYEEAKQNVDIPLTETLPHLYQLLEYTLNEYRKSKRHNGLFLYSYYIDQLKPYLERLIRIKIYIKNNTIARLNNIPNKTGAGIQDAEYHLKKCKQIIDGLTSITKYDGIISVKSLYKNYTDIKNKIEKLLATIKEFMNIIKTKLMKKKVKLDTDVMQTHAALQMAVLNRISPGQSPRPSMPLHAKMRRAVLNSKIHPTGLQDRSPSSSEILRDLRKSRSMSSSDRQLYEEFEKGLGSDRTGGRKSKKPKRRKKQQNKLRLVTIVYKRNYIL